LTAIAVWVVTMWMVRPAIWQSERILS